MDQAERTGFTLLNYLAESMLVDCRFVDRGEILFCEAIAILDGLHAVYAHGMGLTCPH